MIARFQTWSGGGKAGLPPESTHVRVIKFNQFGQFGTVNKR